MAAYNTPATSLTPALVIYLLDVSGSMSIDFFGRRRVDEVSNALDNVIQAMVRRCMKGEKLQPRYHLAVVAYNDSLTSLGEIQTLPDFAAAGIPEFEPSGTTNTYAAFEEAERMLNQILPHYQQCPAPLVCHLTDGEFTTADPTPVARRIMNMKNNDGNVLIENIFISDQLMRNPPTNGKAWRGVTASDLTNPYAQALMAMSSPLPAKMAEFLQEDGFSIQAGAPMMIPAQSPELVQVAFAMSGATGTASTSGSPADQDHA